MFLKNFACLLFSYQCSFCFLSFFVVSDSFYILSSVAYFVNNFFQLFYFVFALSKKALKTKLYFVVLLLPCSATLDTIHPTHDKSQQHFSKYFRTGTLTKMYNYFSRFCAFCMSQGIKCIYKLFTVGVYTNSINAFPNNFIILYAQRRALSPQKSVKNMQGKPCMSKISILFA